MRGKKLALEIRDSSFIDRPFELKKKILEKKILDKIENIMTNNFFFNKYNLILIDIDYTKELLAKKMVL